MTVVCRLFALAVMIVLAPAALAQTQRLHGVLSNRPVEQFCTIFEADDGRNFILTNTGGFQLGDRVYVEGTIPTGSAGVCNEVIYSLLNVSAVRPAYAGVGTIVRQGARFRFRTDDGRLYAIANRGSFGQGARVYVRGWVNTLTSPPTLSDNTIGTPVTGFGRFVGSNAADRRIKGDDGNTYLLDGLSARFIRFGDLVYFEGVRTSVVDTVTHVTSATGRYAFMGTGKVVLQSGVKVMDCDQLIFNATRKAAGLDAFAVGDKVFVYGVAPEDFNHGEVRDTATVRSATVAPGYSTTGTLIDGTFFGDDGSGAVLDFEGPAYPDGYIYVYGRLDTSDPTQTLIRSNAVLQGFNSVGTLEIGFECAPLLSPFFFFVEDEEGIPLFNTVRARGGISFVAAPCPFPALVDDTLIDLGGGGEEF